jgi:hypothetical protein
MSSKKQGDLQAHETDLVGQWLDTGNRIEGDAVCTRIRWLLAERLERLATSQSGGDTLCRDPSDGRLWELTHPWPHLPGGGPPRLTLITPEAADAKYGITPSN